MRKSQRGFTPYFFIVIGGLLVVGGLVVITQVVMKKTQPKTTDALPAAIASVQPSAIQSQTKHMLATAKPMPSAAASTVPATTLQMVDMVAQYPANWRQALGKSSSDAAYVTLSLHGNDFFPKIDIEVKNDANAYNSEADMYNHVQATQGTRQIGSIRAKTYNLTVRGSSGFTESTVLFLYNGQTYLISFTDSVPTQNPQAESQFNTFLDSIVLQ